MTAARSPLLRVSPASPRATVPTPVPRFTVWRPGPGPAPAPGPVVEPNTCLVFSVSPWRLMVSNCVPRKCPAVCRYINTYFPCRYQNPFIILRFLKLSIVRLWHSSIAYTPLRPETSRLTAWRCLSTLPPFSPRGSGFPSDFCLFHSRAIWIHRDR